MIRGTWMTLLPVAMLGLFAAEEGAAQHGSVVDRLVGTWGGKGELFGAEASYRMEWAWVLDGRFLRLEFENRIRGEEGPDRVLSATAFYEPANDGGFQGTWFDSRGKVLPLRATTDDSTLTTNWGSPDTEEGQTVYRLSGKNLMVSDSVLRDGQWRQFGNATYWRRVLTDADAPIVEGESDTALAQFCDLPRALVTDELRREVLAYWTKELLETGTRCGEIHTQVHGGYTVESPQLTAEQLERIRNHELPSFENPIVMMTYARNGEHVAVFDSNREAAVRADVSVWDENCAMWHPVSARRVVDGLFVGRLEIDSQCRNHGSRYVAVYLHDRKVDGLPYLIKRCTFGQAYH